MACADADRDPQALLDAARDGDVARVKALIDAGYNVNASFEGRSNSTALHAASYGGENEVVKVLLENGANVAARNKDEWTPLHWAALNGHEDVAKSLIESGANINARDVDRATPLHDAATTDQSDMIKLLLRYNADIHAQNKEGWTALHLAAIRKHTKTLKTLLHANADMEIRDNNGKMPHELVRGRGQQTRRLKSLFTQFRKQKEYDALMKETGVPQDVCKLYLCGYAEVGKTTLKKSLQNIVSDDEPMEYEPTPGIDVSPVDIPSAGKFSLWDFAGQPEYYLTHNMFLGAQNAIFAIVYRIVNTGDDKPRYLMVKQKEEMMSWLRFIKTTNVINLLSSDGSSSSDDCKPKVILVASRADLLKAGFRKEAEVVHKQLLQAAKQKFGKYLHIQDDIFLLDCRDALHGEMQRLRECLHEAKTKKKIPNLCSEVLNQKDEWIEDKAFPVIDWNLYSEKVKAIDPLLDDDFIVQATNYLQDMGEILYIKSVGFDSRDVVVIQPQWLCSRIFGPMLATEVFVQYSNRLERKKLHSKTDIEEVFLEYTDSDLLIHLLKEFELIFEADPSECEFYDIDEVMYIAPGLLDDVMPIEQWRSVKTKQMYLGRRFECRDETDSFSPGLFPRLQTRLHRHFTEIGCPPSGIWKNGIKLCDEVEGIVYMTRGWKAIHVCVRAANEDELEDCHRLLEIVTTDIYDVLEISCPGTNVDCHILSAHSLKTHLNPEHVRYYQMQKILDAERRSRKVYDDGIGQAENVTDLLCVGFDTSLLYEFGPKCDVKWMLEDTKREFATLMDQPLVSGSDYRQMADLMGIECKDVKSWEGKSTSVSLRILKEWSDRSAKRKRISNRRPGAVSTVYHDSNFHNLIKILDHELMNRQDAKQVIEEMLLACDVHGYS